MTIKVSERIRTTGVVLSMQVKAVIKVSMNGRKYRAKAIRTVVRVEGIESVALTGEEENQLVVIGSSFDAVLLVRLLRKKVGHASLISICQSRWPNDRSQRIGNSSANGKVRKPRLHLPSLKLEPFLKFLIGCYKPSTSVKNSKRLGDRSSKWEPAGNQDFSTGSGSVNPKLPEIRDPLDSDLETTNSVLSLCDKPATSGDNLESLGDQSNAYECTANPTSSTSGSIFLKLQEYGDPLGPDLETIKLYGEVREPRLHLPSLRLEQVLKGKLKLNTDGSTRRHGGGGGFGGLFRDESGSWISGYYGRLEICTSLKAELWAVYRGLTIIHKRGFNQVIIETDAEQVVKLLSEDLGEKCPFQDIVEDARIIMRGCDCSIQHIRREANICADAMAKLGEYQPTELLIVNEPPEELRTLLVADIVHLSQESVFIGCYKPPTSVKNSKTLGDRSSKWEPAGNQDFSTGSGSVNPKLPEIRDPLDSDLETTNSVLSLCDKPATSGDNLESLGDQSNAYECTANPTSSTSGSIFLKLQEYGDPLGPDLETIKLCELNSRTDLVKTVSSTGYKQKLPCHNVKLNSQEEFEIPLNISRKGFLQWNHVLVGCFFDNDKKFDFHLLKLQAESSWKDDLLDVHSLGENGFFMLKFKNENVVDCILSGGPYILGEKLINFKKWEPGLHLSKCVFSFFPIWVKFFNVPLELWTEEGLSFVASVIGKPLFLDEPTRLKSRLTFARVCVEVDATKEIPNSFKINLGYCEPYEIKVEVSWRPWSQWHDVSMAIGEASNSLPFGAEEKGKDVVEDSTFASTSIMFDVLDQLKSMEGPSGDNTEMILIPCPSSCTNLDVLASCAPIVENSRGQRKSKGEDKLFSSNKANPSGLVEIKILGTNEKEIVGHLPRELVETLVKKEDEGLVLGECEL